MANELLSAIIFVVGLAISTIMIYITTKLFGQEEGIGRAFVTAIIGAIVYSIVYFIFGSGWVAAIVGGFIWLIALKGLYDIGWLRARNCSGSVGSRHYCPVVAAYRARVAITFLTPMPNNGNKQSGKSKCKVCRDEAKLCGRCLFILGIAI